VRDTDPQAEQRLVEAWLERSPGERLAWVFDLNEAVAWLAEAGRRMRTEEPSAPRDSTGPEIVPP
jgi:hypothetical protein